MTLPVCVISAFASVVLATSSVAIGESPMGKNSDENKLVCKKQARTGTRFADKICKTNAQWEELRAQQLRDAAELINSPKIETRRGG